MATVRNRTRTAIDVVIHENTKLLDKSYARSDLAQDIGTNPTSLQKKVTNETLRFKDYLNILHAVDFSFAIESNGVVVFNSDDYDEENASKTILTFIRKHFKIMQVTMAEIIGDNRQIISRRIYIDSIKLVEVLDIIKAAGAVPGIIVKKTGEFVKIVEEADEKLKWVDGVRQSIGGKVYAAHGSTMVASLENDLLDIVLLKSANGSNGWFIVEKLKFSNAKPCVVPVTDEEADSIISICTENQA